MFLMGRCYDAVTGQKDLQVAVEWYRSAAKAGHSGAQNNWAALLSLARERGKRQLAVSYFQLARERQWVWSF
jgi:TPR repeat protein